MSNKSKATLIVIGGFLAFIGWITAFVKLPAPYDGIVSTIPFVIAYLLILWNFIKLLITIVTEYLDKRDKKKLNG